MEAAKASGGTIEVVHDIDEAVRDADVIYAKAWGALTETEEDDAKLRDAYRNWCVSLEHFERAAPGAIFMNPMPITRGEEADAEVIDGPMSVMYDEAENRLHVQKAIMSLLM
jgi:ornithine carbamoyltransferase